MSRSPKTCFVIAPIGADGSETRRRSDQVLEEVIQPAATETGYSVLRTDKISKGERIIPQIIEHVLDDHMVIADLTGHNPNVFYQLAIRHAIRKPFVHIIEKGESIPFDVEPICTVQLDHMNHDSTSKSIKELVTQIRLAEQSSSNAFTPVSIAVQIIHSKMDKVAARSGSRVPRLPVGKLGECKVLARMIMHLDPYTGADRPDLPMTDSVGYFPSTEVTGLASGIYDLYITAPGYSQALVASNVTILRQPVPYPVKPHTPLCEKLHYDSLGLIRCGSIPHMTLHHFKKQDTECDCYCHK